MASNYALPHLVNAILEIICAEQSTGLNKDGHNISKEKLMSYVGTKPMTVAYSSLPSVTPTKATASTAANAPVPAAPLEANKCCYIITRGPRKDTFCNNALKADEPVGHCTAHKKYDVGDYQIGDMPRPRSKKSNSAAAGAASAPVTSQAVLGERGLNLVRTDYVHEGKNLHSIRGTNLMVYMGKADDGVKPAIVVVGMVQGPGRVVPLDSQAQAVVANYANMMNNIRVEEIGDVSLNAGSAAAGGTATATPPTGVPKPAKPQPMGVPKPAKPQPGAPPKPISKPQPGAPPKPAKPQPGAPPKPAKPQPKVVAVESDDDVVEDFDDNVVEDFDDNVVEDFDDDDLVDDFAE